MLIQTKINTKKHLKLVWSALEHSILSPFLACFYSLLVSAVAFRIYDMDKDGYISNGELFQVLKMMVGNNLKDTQLQQIVDKTIINADKDGDGRISFEEFCLVRLFILGLVFNVEMQWNLTHKHFHLQLPCSAFAENKTRGPFSLVMHQNDFYRKRKLI